MTTQSNQQQIQTARQQLQSQLQKIEQSRKQITQPQKRPTPGTVQASPQYRRQQRLAEQEFLQQIPQTKEQIQQQLQQLKSLEQPSSGSSSRGVSEYERDYNVARKYFLNAKTPIGESKGVRKIWQELKSGQDAAIRKQIENIKSENPDIQNVIFDSSGNIQSLVVGPKGQEQSISIDAYNTQVQNQVKTAKKTIEDYYKVDIEPAALNQWIDKYNKEIDTRQLISDLSAGPVDLRSPIKQTVQDVRRDISTIPKKIKSSIAGTYYDFAYNRAIINDPRQLPTGVLNQAFKDAEKQTGDPKRFASFIPDKYLTAEQLRLKKKTSDYASQKQLADFQTWSTLGALTVVGAGFPEIIPLIVGGAATYGALKPEQIPTYNVGSGTPGAFVSGAGTGIASKLIPIYGGAIYGQFGRQVYDEPVKTLKSFLTPEGVASAAGFAVGYRLPTVSKRTALRVYDEATNRVATLEKISSPKGEILLTRTTLPNGKPIRVLLVPEGVNARTPYVEQILRSRGIVNEPIITFHVTPEAFTLNRGVLTVNVPRGLYSSIPLKAKFGEIPKELTTSQRRKIIDKFKENVTKEKQTTGQALLDYSKGGLSPKIGIIGILSRIVQGRKFKLKFGKTSPEILGFVEKGISQPRWIVDILSGKRKFTSSQLKTIEYYSSRFDRFYPNETTRIIQDLSRNRRGISPTQLEVKLAKAIYQWSRETKRGVVGGAEFLTKPYGEEAQIVRPLGAQYQQIGTTKFAYIAGKRVPIRFLQKIDPKTGKLEVFEVYGDQRTARVLKQNEIQRLESGERALTDIKSDNRIDNLLTGNRISNEISTPRKPTFEYRSSVFENLLLPRRSERPRQERRRQTTRPIRIQTGRRQISDRLFPRRTISRIETPRRPRQPRRPITPSRLIPRQPGRPIIPRRPEVPRIPRIEVIFRKLRSGEKLTNREKRILREYQRQPTETQRLFGNVKISTKLTSQLTGFEAGR